MFRRKYCFMENIAEKYSSIRTSKKSLYLYCLNFPKADSKEGSRPTTACRSEAPECSAPGSPMGSSWASRSLPGLSHSGGVTSVLNREGSFNQYRVKTVGCVNPGQEDRKF